MTLRLRLFALLVALAALLAVGEWVLVRALSRDLEEELASAAASVSQDVLRMLHLADALPASPADAGDQGKPEGKIERRIFVVQDHNVVKRGPGAASAPPTEGGQLDPLVLAEPPKGPPGTEEARGVIERQTMGPDGTITTERHTVRARFEPGSAAHVVVFRGPKDANAQQVPVPTSGVEHAIERFTRRLLLASLGLFGGALLLGVAVTHRFTRPLHDLAAAARRVGGGELGVHAPAAPGEVGEAVAAFNQMSERLAALDAETRQLRASEQLSELGEVGRGLAHSLRNPLNALGLALDQLAERATPEGAATADAARRQIRRIDGALRGFLALSAGDAAATEVDLTAVARDVALEALQTRSNGGDAARVEVVAPARPVHLRGVEAELRAALQALVVNAVEASPAGGLVVVTVGERDSVGVVTLAVDDQGPGLPASVRERLFTPHVTTKAAGAGMGLYLAHRLATTRYGGALVIADRPESGTRATLTLSDRGAAIAARPTADGAAA
ncbi:MAG TPA: HAMP domain-containing sensor histidine kinase [Thermoanaerobaculia bacterium]|nr:HAMP domain-containing sensor histidine kinase [Thermoanaerobaculia bacterium]